MALDVLHHLREPFQFFASASRSLKPGGRLILIEPAATPMGRALYRLCHHESCDPGHLLPPFRFSPNAAGDFANMGMGQAVFHRNSSWTQAQLSDLGLQLILCDYHEWIAYFLTGGYSRKLPIPTTLVKWAHRFASSFPLSFRRLVATRMTVVLEQVSLLNAVRATDQPVNS